MLGILHIHSVIFLFRKDIDEKRIGQEGNHEEDGEDDIFRFGRVVEENRSDDEVRYVEEKVEDDRYQGRIKIDGQICACEGDDGCYEDGEHGIKRTLIDEDITSYQGEEGG